MWITLFEVLIWCIIRTLLIKVTNMINDKTTRRQRMSKPSWKDFWKEWIEIAETMLIGALLASFVWIAIIILFSL